jgi:hypothetical protein
MAATSSFNADKISADRSKATITIGGRNFHPRKRTVKLMDEWASVSPDGGRATEVEIEDPVDLFRSISKQLNVLLRDDENNEPGVDFLDEELDVEEGFSLLEALTPSLGSSQGEMGNSDRAGVEATT